MPSTQQPTASLPLVNDHLAGLARAVNEFRALAETMPAQQVSVFLAVAQSPGVRQCELVAIVGTSPASISHNLSALSLVNRHGKDGLDLVRSVAMGRGERSPKLYLTPAGEALVRRMAGDQTNSSGQKPHAGLHWEVWTD